MNKDSKEEQTNYARCGNCNNAIYPKGENYSGICKPKNCETVNVFSWGDACYKWEAKPC